MAAVQMVRALLHQIDIRQRDVSASFGRHLIMGVARGWNHGRAWVIMMMMMMMMMMMSKSRND